MSNQYSLQFMMRDQIVVPSLLLKNYVKLQLNESEVMVILQLHCFYQEGNTFPTPEEIANQLTLSGQECSAILRKLIQKNMLSIEQINNESNILDEFYSLEPLWKRLYEPAKPAPPEKSEEQHNIFILFEQEFGRPLSPFEIETINIWIDEEDQSPSLIKAALREAVLMGKLNFRYIDRILREWRRKGIRTVEQARNQSKSFHANQTNKQASETGTESKRDVSLYYNWLEDE
ncbi:DnaD domain protein [Radiobacillus sp. PE A8.2]|uniref:DnaD domain-containing protein n=1 Tax=Radiobacillus sp. PE A8.2 TaxID=3380349 RepID=UPI00388E0D04